MLKRNSESSTRQSGGIAVLLIFVLLFLVVPCTSFSQTQETTSELQRFEIEVIKPSSIIGECDCDTINYQTTCTYTVFSGIPALSHLIFPIPLNCDGIFNVSSPYYSFSTPQKFQDRFCGEVFGIKTDQELTEGQTTTFTLTFDGISPLGIDIVYASLKGGPNCQSYAVPGVVDCERLPCVKWSLSGVEFEFGVLKPGTYAARLATMGVVANTQVNINFESFGDLIPVQPAGVSSIPAFYATTPADRLTPPDIFLAPPDFNQQVITIPGDEQEHLFALWSKLEIGTEITACEYHDEATITLILENHEPWVDGEN